MADLNSLFSKFNDTITLTQSKKDNLRTSRDGLRKKTKDNFKAKNRSVPNFCGQGSFMMKTTINPLPDNEYDIDDGVYLNGYSDMEMKDWPSTQTIHNWIKDAVDGYTGTPPTDKNTCVRVTHSKSYHVDMPAYIIKNDTAYLAHKANGWMISDPKAFSDWFLNIVKTRGEQVRSLVKYLKAWKDYKEVKLKGISITILVGENYYSYNGRDDKALLGTVTNIINNLNICFSCRKPVAPYEDLFYETSDSMKESIINDLNTLKENLDKAINEPDEAAASDYMIKMFGARFPKGEAKKEQKSDYIQTDAPAVIRNDGRSA